MLEGLILGSPASSSLPISMMGAAQGLFIIFLNHLTAGLELYSLMVAG
jgi:hypothetical protein